MFYIETQDGNLPYIRREYETRDEARKAAVKFINEHPQDGSILVADPVHCNFNRLYRHDGIITEDVLSEDNGWVVHVTVHRFVAD